MKRLASTGLFLLLLASVAAAAQTADQRRIALVIGNGDYLHTTVLPNAPNDGRAMAEALRGLDFEVLEGIDVDRRGTEDLIRQFAQRLRGADVGLFYYAGHGLQVDGSNYIVPIDGALEDETDVAFEAVRLDVVLTQLERQPRTNLVFLDACRDNPLAARAGSTRSAAVSRGLARMNGSIGTLIAYATEPDTVALDGDGPHSPFTAALLQHIGTPGLEVRQMLTRVRQQVIADTDSQQVPWDHSSLTGQFFFRPAAEKPAAVAERAADAPPGTGAAELIVWDTVQGITDPAQQASALNLYLETFPNGRFVQLAETQIAALTAPVTEPAPDSPAIAAEPAVIEPPVIEPDVATAKVPAAIATTPEVPRQSLPPGPADVEQSLGLGLNDRRTAQSALTLLGFDTGGIDGVFGSKTRGALREYQEANGDAVTGYLTAETLLALGSAANSSRDSANSCQWAYDGECDEGRFEGSASDSCLAGTDTIDCLGLTLLADGYGLGESCPANF